MTENESKLRTCCFFGHRKIERTENLINKLYEIVEKLILTEKVDTFLFGSRSEFDSLCYDVVSHYRGKYPYIKRIYVRAEYPHIGEDYRQYLLESYEETYFPKKITGAGRTAYVQRNCEMINKSRFCIAYYNAEYTPPRRKKAKKGLSDYQPKSGTKMAFEYAEKKNIHIINIY